MSSAGTYLTGMNTYLLKAGPAAFGPDAVMEPDLMLPGPVAQRAAGSGLLNERALLQMIDALYRRYQDEYGQR